MASIATSGQAMSLKAPHSPGSEALNGSSLHFPDKRSFPEISSESAVYAAGLKHHISLSSLSAGSGIVDETVDVNDRSRRGGSGRRHAPSGEASGFQYA